MFSYRISNKMQVWFVERFFWNHNLFLFHSGNKDLTPENIFIPNLFIYIPIEITVPNSHNYEYNTVSLLLWIDIAFTFIVCLSDWQTSELAVNMSILSLFQTDMRFSNNSESWPSFQLVEETDSFHSVFFFNLVEYSTTQFWTVFRVNFSINCDLDSNFRDER